MKSVPEMGHSEGKAASDVCEQLTWSTTEFSSNLKFDIERDVFYAMTPANNKCFDQTAHDAQSDLRICFSQTTKIGFLLAGLL